MIADITAIIPCYNAEKYIKETLESILNQTLKCKEIIVINDGSTDNTLNILKNFKDKIKIITIKNSGVSIARNIGIKEVKSKYIAFCDADDLWDPQKNEEQIKFIKEKKAKFVCTNAKLIGNSAENFTPLKPKKNPIHFEDLIFNNYIFTSSVLLEKSILEKAGLFWEKLKSLEDWHLWLRISLNEKIYFLDKELIYYRLHPQGLSKNFLAFLKYASLLFEDIFKIAPQYKKFKKTAINNFFFSYGTFAYYYGDYISAKKIFWKCLKQKPISLKTYRFFILSTLRSISIS